MNVNLIVAWKVFATKGLNWVYMDSSASLVKWLDIKTKFSIERENYVIRTNQDLKQLEEWERSFIDHNSGYKPSPNIFRFWPWKGFI